MSNRIVLNQSKISIGCHQLIGGIYAGGYRNGDPVDYYLIIAKAREFAVGLPGHKAAVDLASLTSAIGSRASVYFANFAWGPEWEFLAAECSIPSTLPGRNLRPDLLFYNADGDIVADELKFPASTGTAPNDRAIQQVQVYAQALAGHFGPRFRGVRLVVSGNPESTLFVDPEGCVGRGWPSANWDGQKSTHWLRPLGSQPLLMHRGDAAMARFEGVS